MTVWTIRISLLLFAACLVTELLGMRAHRERPWRIAWTLGFFLALMHVLSAFHFYHDWSHTRAFRATEEQSRALIGWGFGGGLYFNYAFVSLWGIEVAGTWLPFVRSRIFRIAAIGFLAFIAFNGAVIFATGPTRWIGMAASSLVLLACGYRVWLYRLPPLANPQNRPTDTSKEPRQGAAPAGESIDLRDGLRIFDE